MTDRPGATRDEHELAFQGTRLEPSRSVLGHGQGAVRGQGWDTETGPDVEADAVGEPDDPFGGHVGVLLRCAGRPLVAGQVDPDPVANRQVLDPVSDGVDHARPVLVGSDLGKGQ